MTPKKNKTAQPIKISKPVLITAKILESTSPKLAARFALKIFTTPVKFPLPKREEEMDKMSRQEIVLIPELNKKINVYHLGQSNKKILLVHGWSGRGTQLHSIADNLIKNGYSTISFDAPAHGKSEGKKSEMTQFIACIKQLDIVYGPFYYAIGHSLGAMSVLNAAKEGIRFKKIITIGSGDIIKDIMHDFIKKLGMSIATADIMITLFEKKAGQTINNYSSYIAARTINMPVLIIHDEDDKDVNIKEAFHINEYLNNSRLLVTQGLGHRKILGDSKVIKKIIEFINE